MSPTLKQRFVAGEKLSIERATLAREQAAKIAMENEVRRSELLEFDRVVEAYAADLAELRAGLAVIPSRIGPECATRTPAEISQYVAQLIDEALIAMQSPEAAAGTVQATSGGDEGSA
jgi:phage terminase Nu1 subunit (DNA packaging protein)